MTELTLSIDGSRTVDASNQRGVNRAMQALTNAHEANDKVAVRSASLRWRDGDLWIQVSLSLPTTPSNIGTDQGTLARAAANTGVVDDVAAATEAISVKSD
jgi:hypothetical protein